VNKVIIWLIILFSMGTVLPLNAQSDCAYMQTPVDDPNIVYRSLWQFADVPIPSPPLLVDTYFRMGVVNSQRTQYTAAIRFLTASIDQALAEMSAQVQQAQTTSDSSSQFEAFLRILALYPRLAQSYYQRGLAHAALG
jgi:hypothetical protein